jgi:glutamine amidotransferase
MHPNKKVDKMKCKKVCIVDYKLGNLFSVSRALNNIGLNVSLSSNKDELYEADALVLPGVGAFGDAMENLKALDLIDSIVASVTDGKPFMGICLGLQLLFTESEEFGVSKGLDLVSGRVRRFNETQSNGEIRKVPQISWNQIKRPPGIVWDSTPLSNIREGEFMYFVHSFHVEPNESVALTTTNYDGQSYVSSIIKNNIFACQFHPEKSGEEGLKIYREWALINKLSNNI